MLLEIPTKVTYDLMRDTFKFNGQYSVVILNRQGKIVSTWARSSLFWRY